jgi:hypothetical protein
MLQTRCRKHGDFREPHARATGNGRASCCNFLSVKYSEFSYWSQKSDLLVIGSYSPMLKAWVNILSILFFFWLRESVFLATGICGAGLTIWKQSTADFRYDGRL